MNLFSSQSLEMSIPSYYSKSKTYFSHYFKIQNQTKAYPFNYIQNTPTLSLLLKYKSLLNFMWLIEIVPYVFLFFFFFLLSLPV